MSKKELLKLDNQLCFSIYACSRQLTRLYRPLLKKLSLTYPQYLVMLVLWETDGITIKEIGRKLYLDSGTLTPLMKRMEKLGFLTRKRSETDERHVNIYISEKGKKLKRKAVNIPETLLCNSGLTLEKYLVLKTELDTLLEKITEEI